MAFAALAALIASLLLAAPPASADAVKPMLTGWIPYWSTSAGLASYQANSDLFTDISPFWYEAREGAGPKEVAIGAQPVANKAAALSALRAKGKKVIPAITDGTSPRYMAAVLADPAARSAHVASLLNLVLVSGYDGIDLDYEKFAFSDGSGTWATTRPAWAAFVTELADAFHAKGKVVTASVPTSGYWVYDFPTLGAQLDSVRIMTYDYHVGAPGPVAPIWWVRQETKTMLSMIPAAKLMMGVPEYGRDWVVRITDDKGATADAAACPADTPTSTRAVTAANTQTITSIPGAVVVRDPQADEVKVTYSKAYSGGGKACTVYREAWLADAGTVSDRVQAVVGLGARGAALWTVGGEDPAQWPLLRAFAQPATPTDVPAGGTVRISAKSPNSTVMGNLTVTGAKANGYLTAWPCDQSRPTTSVATYAAGATVATFATVRTDAAGDFCVFTSAATSIIWDQSATSAMTVGERMLDTTPGGPVPPGGTVRIATGVPSSNVMGTLSVIDPAANGYTTVWPCAEGRPTTSVNNFAAGQSTAATAAVRTDVVGDVCIYTTALAHLVWDQQRGAPAMDLGTPERRYDSRTGGAPPIAAGGTVKVPGGAADTTVVGNLTVTGPEAGGYTTVWTCGEPRPLASTNNYLAGETTANLTAVRTDANGDFCAYTSAATHLIWDQSGTSSGWVAQSPQRLLDTGAPVVAGSVTKVPTGKPNSAVAGNLTFAAGSEGQAFADGALGELTAYPCDVPAPDTRQALYAAGETGAVFAGVRTDANGEFCVRATEAARLVWDQLADAPVTQAHSPTRLLDTRTGGGAPVPAKGVIRVAAGAPSTTVLGTLTITGAPTSGYTTAWPCAEAQPTTSVNNHGAYQTTSNLTAVRTDDKGEFCVFTWATAHLVWDQVAETSGIVAGTPVRRVDTRSTGIVPAGGTVEVPTGAARALVLGNLTVTGGTASGYTTAWPCDRVRPLASVSNYLAGRTVPNFAASGTDANSKVCVYVSAPVHVVFDEVATTATVDGHSPVRLFDSRLS